MVNGGHFGEDSGVVATARGNHGRSSPCSAGAAAGFEGSGLSGMSPSLASFASFTSFTSFAYTMNVFGVGRWIVWCFP